MIELLKGFPDNVAAFALHGQVTKAADLEGFDPGAVWEDQKLGWKHFFDWERCAMVTDVAWAKHIAKFSEFFGFLWPGEYRFFQKLKPAKHTIGSLRTRNTGPADRAARRAATMRRAIPGPPGCCRPDQPSTPVRRRVLANDGGERGLHEE